MINQNKWIRTIPKINNRFNEEANQLDHSRWINTISKKDTYTKKDAYGPIRKYSLAVVLFVSGLLLVSTVKNETRNLQKEISNLQASVNVVKYNLDQALLDNEVITTPENISRLAKKYLSDDLEPYNKSQIRHLDEKSEIYIKVSSIKNKKKEKLPKRIKGQVAKKINEKKTEIRKLQELYYNPKSIPSELKIKIAKQIKEKKIKLQNIYQSPKDTFTFEKMHRWGAIQLVKVFLGIPIVPGR